MTTSGSSEAMSQQVTRIITDQDLSDQFAYQDLRENYPFFWMAAYHHRNVRGGRMDFVAYSWQGPLYKDHSLNIVIKKAAQVGVSEWAFVRVYCHAMLGQIVMYVFPTDADRNVVVPRRIDRVIDKVPFYRDHCAVERKGSDMKSQKTLFGVDCMFLGSKSPTTFYEKPVDVLIVDEFDKCDLSNLEYAKDRLASSSDPHTYKFGNPTVSGIGIDYEYEKSDQKEWFIKCSHCGERQPLDWFVNFVEETTDGWRLNCLGATPDLTTPATALCRGCRKVIDRLGDGEWVAKYPDRDVSGYHVSRLFGDIRHGIIDQLFQEWVEAQSNPTALQRFYNNVLGIAYDASGSKVTETDLSACACDYVMAPTCEGFNVAGCDVGGKLHLHISSMKDGVRRKVFVGTVPTFDELDRICKLYNVRYGVIDALPDTHATKDFLRDHSGWYMCYYYPTDNIGDYKVDHSAPHPSLRVDRTQSLDASHADYQRKKVELPKDWRSLDNGDFVKQMTALTRVYDERRGRFVWTTGNVGDTHKRPDHHRHADNYEKMAAEISGGGGKIVVAA